MSMIERDQTLPLNEEPYHVRVLSSPEDLDASFRLRHRIYAESLNWVPPSPDGREMDHYDGWGTSLGLFGVGDALLGVVRLLPSYGPLMIEDEFAALLDREQPFIRGPMVNEITRLAIDPGEAHQQDKSKLLLLLLKGMYRWLTEQGVRYSYMVVERRVFRMLRAIGFPCRAISPAMALPPAHAVSLAAVLDWNEFREENARARPAFLEWMTAPTMPGCESPAIVGVTARHGFERPSSVRSWHAPWPGLVAPSPLGSPQ